MEQLKKHDKINCHAFFDLSCYKINLNFTHKNQAPDSN
jgi:hypothetical protein